MSLNLSPGKEPVDLMPIQADEIPFVVGVKLDSGLYPGLADHNLEHVATMQLLLVNLIAFRRLIINQLSCFHVLFSFLCHGNQCRFPLFTSGPGSSGAAFAFGSCAATVNTGSASWL